MNEDHDWQWLVGRFPIRDVDVDDETIFYADDGFESDIFVLRENRITYRKLKLEINLSKQGRLKICVGSYAIYMLMSYTCKKT